MGGRRIFEAGSLLFILGCAIVVWQVRAKQGFLDSLDDSVLIRSPASARQIDNAFRDVGAWAMVGLGESFKHAERLSGINAIFLASIAIHESDRGLSKIATDKNNLFGWGAYDKTPYESAFSFPTREAGIEHVALRLRRLYVEQWNLSTVREIGDRYASDPGWAVKVMIWAGRLQSAIYD